MIRIAALILTAALLAPSIASADQCPILTPGQSLGPIKIGMTEAQLAATGLTVTPHQLESMRVVGDFEVSLKGGVVSWVETDSRKNSCVSINGDSLDLSRPPEALALSLSAPCGDYLGAIGGSTVTCEGALFFAHMGGQGARVTQDPAPADPCTRYVHPGAVGDPLVSRAEVDAAAPVCVGGRRYTHDLVPDDITKLNGKMHVSTCEVRIDIGATVVDCHYSGLRFIFGGVTAKLGSIEAIAIKK